MESLQALQSEIRALSAAGITSVDDAKKLHNSSHNCFRDLLRKHTQTIDAPAGVQKLINNINEKSSQKSDEFRKSGNDLIRKGEHNEIDHKMILHFYTKSIAFAPPNSEELALAYNNRSILWSHLQKYDLCLRDTNRALEITQCKTLIDKLLARKQKCLDLHEGIKKNDKKLKLPTLKPSKLVPCAADSITLAYNEKYGRHYTATRNMRPGEIILIEESPYVSVNRDQTYLVCAHCLAFAWAGIPCDFCVSTIYCNETCKKKNWDLYHDCICKKLSSIESVAEISKEFVGLVDFATRILEISIKRERIETILEEADIVDKAEGLQPEILMREENLNCQKFRTLYSLSNGKIIDASEPTSLFTIRDKLTYIQNLNSSKFVAVPVGSGDRFECCKCIDLESCLKHYCTNRGTIIGPCSMLMNHSCVPNVATVFVPGPKIIMITQKPVKKGEQLFVSYGPRADVENISKASRQDTLLKNQFFKCDCEGCTHNWPDSCPAAAFSKSEKSMFKAHLSKTFGKYSDMLMNKPSKDWTYSEDLFKASVELIELIYRSFPAWEAFTISSLVKYYLRRCFSHLHGEGFNDFPITC